MTKQKKSFFEKLTGIKRIEEEDQEIAVRNTRQSQGEREINYERQEDVYEFPDYGESFQDNEADYEEVENEIPPIKTSSQNKEMVDSEGQLTIDVYQTDTDIVIKSTIAGVKPEDLDVNISNDMVTVRGERKQEEEIDSENYYYQECYWGPFSRSVVLPVEIVTEKAEAGMKNGILTVRLPKADVSKTRKIQVRGF